IARRGDLVVFVEVKSRNTAVYGGPLYAINERKKTYDQAHRLTVPRRTTRPERQEHHF
ncbi:MAG: hypothetical protein EHM32_07630, partial [Spirochaetales bacterium]